MNKLIIAVSGPSTDLPPNVLVPEKQDKPSDGVDKSKLSDANGSKAALKSLDDSIESKLPTKPPPPDDPHAPKLPTFLT